MNNLIYKLKKSDFADKITLIVAMVLLVVLFGALNRNYVTGANMINILIACSLTGFVAIGETNLIIANQNDLSAGSVAACAGVLAAILAREGVPAILALAIAVCAGFLVGAVNAGLSPSSNYSPLSRRWPPCRWCAASLISSATARR